MTAWTEIDCAAADNLLASKTLRALSGRTDMELGLLFRTWGLADDTPVLRDERVTGHGCKHWKWTPDTDTEETP